MAKMSVPVPRGLDARRKPLRCPGLMAMAVRGWVCLGCVHGPDSHLSAMSCTAEVTADTLCRWFM